MNEGKTLRYHVRRREFLNEDPELPAYVIGVVQDTSDISDNDEQRWKWGTVILDFGDCTRRVSFDLDLSGPEERASTLRKINLIAEVVNSVRDAIAKEIESRNARQPVQDLTQGAVAYLYPKRCTVDAEFASSNLVSPAKSRTIGNRQSAIGNVPASVT
jgi:hypothetical protein